MFGAKWWWISQVLHPDSFGSTHLGEQTWILKTLRVYGVRDVLYWMTRAGNTPSCIQMALNGSIYPIYNESFHFFPLKYKYSVLQWACSVCVCIFKTLLCRPIVIWEKHCRCSCPSSSSCLCHLDVGDYRGYIMHKRWDKRHLFSCTQQLVHSDKVETFTERVWGISTM